MGGAPCVTLCVRVRREPVRAISAMCLGFRARARCRDVGDPQEKLLAALNERAAEVFKLCGFDTAGNPSTLSMLTSLEVGTRARLACPSHSPTPI
jgi:hypothetical protein